MQLVSILMQSALQYLVTIVLYVTHIHFNAERSAIFSSRSIERIPFLSKLTVIEPLRIIGRSQVKIPLLLF